MPFKDTLIALLVALLWGAQVTAVKIGGTQLPPILMVAIRFAIMAVFLLPFLKRIPSHNLGVTFLVATVTGTLHFGLLYCGIARVDASTSALIYQLATPFTLVLAWLMLGEAIKLQVIGGIILALAGVLILMIKPSADGTVAGMLLVALAALAFAAGSVLTKRLRPFDSLALSAWTAIIAAPQLLLWSMVQELDQWPRVFTATPEAWGAVLYTALSGGLLGFGLWFWLLGRHAIQQLSPFLLLVPLFAIAINQLLLAEGLNDRLLLGGALTMAGVTLCQLRWRPRGPVIASTKGAGRVRS
jgi:O-acetylserine/cysteine efflux transporter